MNIKKLKRLKNYYTIISLFTFCSMMIYGFIISKLTIDYPLSKLGIYEETNVVWIGTLIVLSVSILVNSISYLVENNVQNKILLFPLFTTSVFCLLGVSFFNMGIHGTTHNIFAGLFFILYTISIFLFGILIIQKDFRIGSSSIIISILMLGCFLWLLHQPQLFPEIGFIILSFTWNFMINSPSDFKKMLRFFNH